MYLMEDFRYEQVMYKREKKIQNAKKIQAEDF